MLLGVIACLLLIVNQFVTNHSTDEGQSVTAEPSETVPNEEKQSAAAEPKTAVSDKENSQDSPMEMGNKKDVEEKTEIGNNQEGYMADWFQQTNSQENEKTAASSKGEVTDQEKSDELNSEDKAAETTMEQSNEEAGKQQSIISPVPPVEPEQPSFSEK